MGCAVALFACAFVSVVETPAAAKEKMELFAAEAWYKNQLGKEEWFEGTLQHFPLPKGTATIGRYNPYRLKMDKGEREVYVGGQEKLLLPYVGKRIKLFGKGVEIEVVGRVHQEIWPARLELVKTAPKPSGVAPAPAPAEAENARPSRELKILARAPLGGAVNVQQPRGGDARQVVVRSEEEFKTAFGEQGQLVKGMLKVETIDFQKHMLVHVTAGSRSTGGYRVEITRLAADDAGKKLAVAYIVHVPTGFVTQAFTHPGEIVLVERFDGAVTFQAASAKPR